MVLLRSLQLRHIQSVSSGLQGYVSKDTHHRPGDRYYNPFSNHFIKSALYLLHVLELILALGMLNRENIRVGPDGISSKHVANGQGLAGVVTLKVYLRVFFTLSTFNMYIITQAYLQGSWLPLSTKALGWRCAAAWLGWVHKGVTESDMFCGLPQATRGWGWRDT